MSTVTSSSPPGYVPMKSMLEEASLTQLLQELALRLIGPEKAKLLKSSGVNLDALCQALNPAQTDTTPSTHGSVGGTALKDIAETLKQKQNKKTFKEYFGTSTYHPVYGSPVWPRPSFSQPVDKYTELKNRSQLYCQATESTGTHGYHVSNPTYED